VDLTEIGRDTGYWMYCVQNRAVVGVGGGCNEHGTASFMGYAVAQLVEALRYKPEGCRFNSRGCH